MCQDCEGRRIPTSTSKPGNAVLSLCLYRVNIDDLPSRAVCVVWKEGPTLCLCQYSVSKYNISIYKYIIV